MSLSTKKLNLNMLLSIVVLAMGIFLFLYKLDYETFFTDEILYVKSGFENWHGDFTLAREVPPIGKYIAGFMAFFTERDVFLFRLPFALIGAVTSLLIYYIVNKEYGKKWAFVGSFIYILSPFIYSSARMAILEAPLHFFWLLFHIFFYKFIKERKTKDAIISGLFIGLSLASKIPPSLILYPFTAITLAEYIFLTKQKISKKLIFQLAGMYTTSGLGLLIIYIPLIIKNGSAGLLKVPQAMYDIYFKGRDQKGKEHVVGDGVFSYSPWWYYLFFIKQKYSIPQLLISIFAPISIFFERSFFTLYWTTFLIISLFFFQILNVKAARYISSMELPLVILAVVLIRYAYKIMKDKKIANIVLTLLLIILLVFRLLVIKNIVPTKYNALEKLLLEKTRNFENGERTYIFGSIRSSRWQFSYVADDLIVSRKDFKIMSPEFPNFKYIAIDTDEALKDPGNELLMFIKTNREFYDLIRLPGINVYMRNTF